jgi:hypothetical protein
VISNVVAKNIERRAYEAHDTVGVMARPATLNDGAARRKALNRERRVTRTSAQKREIFRERRQAKSARTALASTLVRHPSDNSLGLTHGATFAGEHDDDAGAR